MADMLPARIISYAWGESYVEELLTLAIPALLAPGNLPYFASRVKCDLTLVTEERFFAKIAAHPVIAKARTHCPIRLVSLDDLVTRNDKYGMALTYALHRGFADLGPAMTDHWLIFFNADFILADGSLQNLLDHFLNGQRIIAAPSYCTDKENSIPALRKLPAPDAAILAIPPREMARIILRHRHTTVRGKTVNDPVFHMHYMDQFYWLADDNTLLGHQMPVAIVGMRPERYVEEPNAFWDHGLIREFCPTSDVKVLGDSDEFLMLELRSAGVAQDQIVNGSPDARELAERMISWVTPYQASFAHAPLTLHAADIPPSIDEARRQLDDFVGKVMSYAPKFPSHLDHPQWDYHWPDFMKSRHAFLSRKYSSMTADLPPPQWMYQIDRLWWRLNGIKTAHARKVGLIADAIKEVDREREIYPRLLAEKLATVSLPDTQATPPGNPGLVLAQHSDCADICAQPDQISGEISSIVQAVDDAFTRKHREANQKKAILSDAISAAEREFAQREGAAYDDLKRQYKRLMQPRVKTAAIPIVQRRVGNEAPVIRVERNLRRHLRPAYDAVFGRWPRVTMLNPYWAALRPFRRAINQARTDGARDVLLVGSDPGICEVVKDFAEAYSWVSVAGMLSGLFHRAIPEEQAFDLCVLDLTGVDSSGFPEVIAAARPYVVPGGRIIVFQMNGGKPLSTIPPPLEATPEFSGSALAVRAEAIRSAGFSHTDGSRLSGLTRGAAALALSTSVALVANCVEAISQRRALPVPARLRTSVTATIPIRLFEGDNGSIDYAVAAGVYVAGVEAPIVPENQVAPETANPPGTAVILTFGQSNAANAGAAPYAPRHSVHVFNVFDMKYYKAADPLPGATNDGGSVWSRLGDKLIESGQFSSVLFVPIAFGGSFIKDWATLKGNCYRRLQFALARSRRAGIHIDLLCWHQGEAEANHTMMSADEYASRFRYLVKEIRRAGVSAPIYVATASICENGPHPHYNHEQIRRAQQQLVSPREGLLPGPDTDEFDGDFRSDGCHLSEKGLDAFAQAWLEAIIQSPPSRLRRSRLGNESKPAPARDKPPKTSGA